MESPLIEIPLYYIFIQAYNDGCVPECYKLVLCSQTSTWAPLLSKWSLPTFTSCVWLHKTSYVHRYMAQLHDILTFSVLVDTGLPNVGFTDFLVPLVGGTPVLLVFSVPFFSRRAILPEVFTWSRDLLTWGGLDRFGDV